MPESKRDFRELDWGLGELAIAPEEDAREMFHSSTSCPGVVAGFRVIQPGDDIFGDALDLEWCAWCRRKQITGTGGWE